MAIIADPFSVQKPRKPGVYIEVWIYKFEYNYFAIIKEALGYQDLKQKLK